MSNLGTRVHKKKNERLRCRFLEFILCQKFVLLSVFFFLTFRVEVRLAWALQTYCSCRWSSWSLWMTFFDSFPLSEACWIKETDLKTLYSIIRIQPRIFINSYCTNNYNSVNISICYCEGTHLCATYETKWQNYL